MQCNAMPTQCQCNVLHLAIAVRHCCPPQATTSATPDLAPETVAFDAAAPMGCRATRCNATQQRNATQCIAAQRNAWQGNANATQRNVMQLNATQRSSTPCNATQRKCNALRGNVAQRAARKRNATQRNAMRRNPTPRDATQPFELQALVQNDASPGF